MGLQNRLQIEYIRKRSMTWPTIVENFLSFEAIISTGSKDKFIPTQYDSGRI